MDEDARDRLVETLALAGALSMLTGLAFGWVARGVHRRAATGDARLARAAHATWWLGLGTYLVVQGGFTFAAAFAPVPHGIYLATRALTIPLLCAAVWGITFYIVFLYSGSDRAALPLAMLYIGVVALFAWATFAAPQTITVQRWIIELDDSAPAYRLVYALVGLPPIIASLAYLLLLRRVSDRAQRYRIVLVAGSILAYVGSGLAARLAASDAVIFVTLVVFGLGAAAASLLAYYPPAAIRRRLERPG